MERKEKLTAYEWEYSDAFERILSQRKIIPETKYFLAAEYSWAGKRAKPKVVILGTGILEELVYACGASPYWLIGGSLASTVWSDELVPRDTDPVSRSILGYINKPDGADFSDALFIIPLVSDSMRKIAYQLKSEGRKLCLVDIPPDRTDSKAAEKWQRQMLEMTNAVSSHKGKRMTKKSLIEAAEKVSRARFALVSFLNVSRGRPDIIPDSVRLLVQDSYYRTDNIAEWTYHLRVLTVKTAALAKRYANAGQDRPRVLLMGSPVIFPNYKIPFLVNDVGLDLLDTADSSALKQYLIYENSDLRGSHRTILRNIASAWYGRDASSAFVKNEALFSYISWRVKKRDIEGVVYHVLKGQIEYDFELERFEKLFADNGIPVFRLETDYQYQDIEQLRIRLEAFSEMLAQNRYKEVKQAK